MEDYDALILPGGVRNPDQLRTNKAAIALYERFGFREAYQYHYWRKDETA